jgi:hypothetical protein
VQQDRYCRDCGEELMPEDRFCAGCGRPVHTTARVPTPEANVSVPPPPQQAEASPQPPQATEQTAGPSPQPQERPPGRWSRSKRPILLFLGSVIVSSLLVAVAAPSTAGETVVYVIAYAVGSSLNFQLTFIPIWLVLGGLVYLVARLLGRKPRFFRVVFDWWVTVAVTIPILLVGLTSQ